MPALPFDLTFGVFAVLAASVLLGALVQSTIGLGLGLIAVPVFAVAAPETLPGVLLVLVMPLLVLVMGRELGAVDRAALVPLLAGRVIGTLAAVWLLLVLSSSALNLLFGATILAGVALSLVVADLTPTRPTQVLAGAASGLFATAAAVGGPPLGLLYQRRPGPELRATLSAVFLIGGALSLAALSAASRLTGPHLTLAALLLPALLGGYALSRPVRAYLDVGWLRPAVLAFAGLGGVLAILRGLLG